MTEKLLNGTLSLKINKQIMKILIKKKKICIPRVVYPRVSIKKLGVRGLHYTEMFA